RLVEAATRAGEAGELRAGVESPQTRARLMAVLGASTTLGDQLVANPHEWRCLAEPAASPPHREVTDVAGLRTSYRQELLRIAADDLTGVADVEQTMARLSDLADATLASAYQLAGGAEQAGSLAVVAM